MPRPVVFVIDRNTLSPVPISRLPADFFPETPITKLVPISPIPLPNVKYIGPELSVPSPVFELDGPALWGEGFFGPQLVTVQMYSADYVAPPGVPGDFQGQLRANEAWALAMRDVPLDGAVVFNANFSIEIDFRGTLVTTGTFFETWQKQDLAALSPIVNPRDGDDLPNLIEGTPQADRLVGDALDDDIRGFNGADRLFGGVGDDTLSGGGGTDRLFGGGGEDILFGGLGRDTLDGGRGPDVIDGGRGNDVLRGGAGADVIYLGPGNDTVTGGRGADVFILEAGAGRDRITDFRPGQGDRIAIDSTDLPVGTTPEEFLSTNVTRAGRNTIVSLDDGSRVVLVGVTNTAAVIDAIEFF